MAAAQDDQNAALATILADYEALMKRRGGLTPEQLEEGLLAITNRMGRDRIVVDVQFCKKVMMEWGVDPLIVLLKPGLKNLATGQRVMSTNLYGALTMMIFSTLRASSGDGVSAPELHKFFLEQLQRYVKTVTVPALSAKRGVEQFEELRCRWDEHKVVSEWFRLLFRHLDGPHAHSAPPTRPVTTGEKAKKLTLMSIALREFKKEVFDGPTAREVVMKNIQDMIAADRRGEAVDKSMLKSVVELYIVMGLCEKKSDVADRAAVEALTRDTSMETAGDNVVYRDSCEKYVLQHSEEYYSAKALEWKAADDVVAYARNVDSAFDAEAQRVRSYLHATTGPKLDAALTKVLVINYVTWLRDGLPKLFAEAQDKREDIARMFRLMERAKPVGAPSGAVEFANELKKHLIAVGDIIREGRRQRIKKQREGAAGPSASAAAPAPTEASAAAAAAKKPRLTPDDTEFVMGIITLHVQFKSIVTKECHDDAECVKGLSNAFRHILNEPLDDGDHADGDTPGTVQSLVAYLDEVLRGRSGKAAADAGDKAASKLSETEIRERWKNAVELYPLINDKDVFLEAYRSTLAKRLLGEKSASMDEERGLISHIKTHAGAAATNKLEIMLNNMNMSEEDTRLVAAVETVRAATSPTPEKVDFRVRVLTMGHWPKFANIVIAEAKLPPPMRFYWEQFQKVYVDSASYKSRKLYMAWSQGSAEVVLRFEGPGDKRVMKTLTSSTLQLFVMLSMNASADNTVTISQLSNATGIETAVMRRVLAPLIAFPLYKRLQLLRVKGIAVPDKMTMSSVGDADALEVNPDFANSKLAKMSLSSVDLDSAETDDRKAATEDRKNITDACLVRIMKARKGMPFHDLVNEAITQLSHTFKPDSRQVKKCIEGLIDREYLERDAADSTKLLYLA